MRASVRRLTNTNLIRLKPKFWNVCRIRRNTSWRRIVKEYTNNIPSYILYNYIILRDVMRYNTWLMWKKSIKSEQLKNNVESYTSVVISTRCYHDEKPLPMSYLIFLYEVILNYRYFSSVKHTSILNNTLFVYARIRRRERDDNGVRAAVGVQRRRYPRVYKYSICFALRPL